jgi:predicted PurR-regulated permease PerM
MNQENGGTKSGGASLSSGRFTINITSGSIVRAILFVVLLIFLYYIRDIILVILAAVVIASAIEPATRWFAKYRIKRLPAVIIMYLLLVAVLGGFFVFFVPKLLDQSIAFLNTVPTSVSLGDLWSPLKDSNFIPGSVAGALPGQSFSIADAVDSLKAFLGTPGSTFQTASYIFGGALSFFLIIILSFYLAVQNDGVGDFLRIITPLKHHDYIADLWRRSQNKIGHWLQGQLLLALMIGLLVYLGLMILGIQHALLLAFVAACFELIPIFGPILSAIPAVLVAFATVGATEGLLVIGLYLIIHQFENNLLYPLVVKKIVGISPILVIIALTIGFKLAGFLGAILAVPVAAALLEYIHDVEKGRRPAVVSAK